MPTIYPYCRAVPSALRFIRRTIMKQTKAFFVTFFISTSVMICCFTALYWIVGYSAPQSAAENKTGVPILTPDYNDTKTALIVMDTENATRNLQLSLKITFHFYKKKERLPHHRDSLFQYYQVLKNYSSNMISII